MLAIIGAVLSQIIGGLAGPVLSYFTNKQTVTLEGFKAASADDLARYQSYVAALNQANAIKAADTWWGARVMVFAFGLPAVIHWGAVFLDSTFRFGWRVPALPGAYAGAEQQIALSFFIILPAMPIVSAVSAWLSRK